MLDVSILTVEHSQILKYSFDIAGVGASVIYGLGGRALGRGPNRLGRYYYI